MGTSSNTLLLIGYLQFVPIQFKSLTLHLKHQQIKMVVETYSDKEVAVGTCEMAPEMFQEAIKITKDAIALPTNAEAAKKIKSCFEESMEVIGWQLLVKVMDSSLRIKQKTLLISSLERQSRL